MDHPRRTDPVRITIIDPVVLDAPLPAPDVAGALVERRSLSAGTASIESRWDDAFAVPGIIDAAIRAEEAGAQAIVVNCMDDPGVDAAREVVRIPVVGVAEAAMHLALCLSGRFTIATTTADDVPIARELVARHRLDHRCASIRPIGLPPLGLLDDDAETFRLFADAAVAAIEQDGAEAIIAGCTLLADQVDRLDAHLLASGIDVPVIDPLLAGLHHAQTLVRLGVSHSPLGWPAPDAKDIVWPGAPLRLGPALEGTVR
ncbi:MAG: aspartate/glutamate racemase family protein [Microbacterium sp.]|nr:aspartate/glutamate racemase family protein [Microbacterium sp.]